MSELDECYCAVPFLVRVRVQAMGDFGVASRLVLFLWKVKVRMSSALTRTCAGPGFLIPTPGEAVKVPCTVQEGTRNLAPYYE